MTPQERRPRGEPESSVSRRSSANVHCKTNKRRLEKLAAEFSKPHGTSRGFSSSNAPSLYLFQRARIFCSYDRSNLLFLHRPQSDFTVMKCCHNHPSTPEILNRSRPLMGWSGRAHQRAQFRIDLRSASKRADVQRQYRRKPARCHRTSVSGRMIMMALRTDGNHRYSMTKNKRALFVSWTRLLTLRCSTII